MSPAWIQYRCRQLSRVQVTSITCARCRSTFARSTSASLNLTSGHRPQLGQRASGFQPTTSPDGLAFLRPAGLAVTDVPH